MTGTTCAGFLDKHSCNDWKERMDMRAQMMIAVMGFGAMALFPVSGTAQEPWPERREEWRERCLQIREEIAHAHHEERRDMEEGERHEAREDAERLEHRREEFREHRCEDILRR
jgi:hypothetical protein